MATKKIHVVTLMHLDIDSVARCDDAGVYRHMQVAMHLNKKSFFPRNMKYDRYTVEKAKGSVTIHLLQGETEKARFSFIQSPIMGCRD